MKFLCKSHTAQPAKIFCAISCEICNKKKIITNIQDACFKLFSFCKLYILSQTSKGFRENEIIKKKMNMVF